MNKKKKLSTFVVACSLLSTPLLASCNLNSSVVVKTGTVKLTFDDTLGTVTADKENGNEGDKVTLTITPINGYEVVSVKINGEEVEIDTTEFELLEGENTVEVVFEEILVPSIDKVKEYLEEIKKGNYTLSFEKDGATSSYYRTERYDFRETTNEGHVLLEDVNEILGPESGKSISHFLKTNEDGDVVLGQVQLVKTSTGGNSVLTSINAYDYLPYVNLEEVAFSENEAKTVFTTINEDVIYSVGLMIESIAFISIGESVEFSFNSNKQLVVTPKLTGGEFPSFTFTEVGSTSVDAIDEYLESFDGSYTKLTDEQASTVLSKTAKLSSDIYQIEDGVKSLFGNRTISYDETHLELDATVGENSTHDSYVKYYTYICTQVIDAQNTVNYEKVDDWSNFNWISKAFEADDFIKVGEDTYQYIGYNANYLTYHVALTSLGSFNFDFITLTLEDDKVATLTFETSSLYETNSSDETVIKKMLIETNVSLPEGFDPEPVPFEEDDETSRVAAAFAKFDGHESFTLITGDQANPSSIKTWNITPELITCLENGKYTAYKLNEDGKVITITFNGSGSSMKASQLGNPSTKTSLAEVIAFGIKPVVMTFDEDGNIVPKEGTGGLPGHLGILAHAHRAYGINKTLKIKVSENGQNVTVNYDYGTEANQKEYAQMFMFGTTTINADVLNAIEHMNDPTGELTSWEEDYADGAALLKQVFGNKYTYIPYVYVEGASADWSSCEPSGTSMITVKFYYGSKKTEIKAAYTALYQEYAEDESNSWVAGYNSSTGVFTNMKFYYNGASDTTHYMQISVSPANYLAFVLK